GLLALVADDAVGVAPPELEGDARERERACIAERAAHRERDRRRLRRAADLLPRELLQSLPQLAGPDLAARVPAREVEKLAVLQREVGDGVEDRSAGEERRMPRDEQQCLLAAHRAAERVDAR